MTLNKLASAPAGEVVSASLTGASQTIGGAVDGLNYQSVAVQVTGTFSGTLTFQSSVDGTNWVSRALVPSTGAALTSTLTAVGVWSGDIGARYFRVNFTSYTSGTAVVTVEFSGASQVNAVSTQPISGSVTATSTPATATAYSLVTTVSTNAASVKGSAGSLYEITVSNVTATASFIKLYNKATAPTVGTDVPILTISAPANTTVALDFGAVGKRFATGIAIAATAAIAATDTANTVAAIQISASYI